MNSYLDLFFNHVIYENLQHNHDEKLILRDGSEFSYDSLQLCNIDNFINFHKKVDLDSFITDATPFIVITGSGSIRYLEQKKYNKEIIEYLNLHGLGIYLYNELQINSGLKIKNYMHCEDKSDHSNISYVFNTTEKNLDSLYSFELESIKQFVKRNKLINVTVNCRGYNVEKYFQKFYPTLKIKSNNAYVYGKIKSTSLVENTIDNRPNSIIHKFLLSSTDCKEFQHLTVGYLHNKNCLTFCNYDNLKNNTLQNSLWFNLSKWKTKNKNQFLKLAINLKSLNDKNLYSLNHNDISTFNKSSTEYFEKCFCSVILETYFTRPFGEFTENTINALNNFHPFILVASPNTLDYLKYYGFKTFSDFWDESYDKEQNHEDRLIKIFQLIDYLDSKSVDYLKNMYDSMKPILIHNYNNIRNINNLNYNKGA
jgi:hypothetical protein